MRSSTRRSRRWALSSLADEIVRGARAESEVWVATLRDRPRWQPVFSPLAPPEFALGLETVYEGYLVHYASGRLFEPPDGDEVLLGDYLYAHGLVRISEAGGVAAVGVMAELISRCAALRADGLAGADGEAWVTAARDLGGSPAEDEIEHALAAHSDKVAP